MIIQQAPQTTGFMMQLLRMGLRSFKPGRQLEEALDEMVAQTENQPPQQQEGDGEAAAKAQEVQLKAQDAQQNAKIKMGE